MAWYRLAANQNDPIAYNNIGVFYDNEFGISQDHGIAMEYFLKAVGDNNNNNNATMLNIGNQFLYGRGVPVDKYKALEWPIKGGYKPEEIKKLNKEGIHLKEQDKNKTVCQLRIESLKHSNSSFEQQLKDKEEIINSLKREIEASKKTTVTFEILVQSKDNEINFLRVNSNIEQKYQELKRRLEPTSSADNNNVTSNNDNNEITNHNTINGNRNSNVIDSSIGINAEEKEFTPCQVGNKKRKA